MGRIAQIEVRAVAPDVERLRYTDLHSEVFTTTTIVRVRDEEGVHGIGAYDADSFGDWTRAPLETLRTLVPSLLGTSVDDVEAIAAILDEDGTSPFPPGVRSAVDIALWDLAARTRELPLHKFLGVDEPDPMESYASVPLLGQERTYLEAIAGYATDGFRAVKLHAWGDPSRDAALLRSVRVAFPELVVMHDAEGRYDREGALLVAEACMEIEARWLEAPLPDFDVSGYRALRRRAPGLPILPAGDAVWDPRLMAELLRDPPWDAVRFDVSFVGGITKTRRLMAVAADAGLPVELISYGHTLIQSANLHAALAFDRTSYFEQPVPSEPFEHGVCSTLRTAKDGRVRAPAGPGLGIELDEAAIESATLDTIRVGREGWG